MQIPLTQITSSPEGELKHGLKTVLFGLDVDGLVWLYNNKHDKWTQLGNPRTGAGKQFPEDPGDTTPSWRQI